MISLKKKKKKPDAVRVGALKILANKILKKFPFDRDTRCEEEVEEEEEEMEEEKAMFLLLLPRVSNSRLCRSDVVWSSGP
jgi:hypothetical protein